MTEGKGITGEYIKDGQIQYLWMCKTKGLNTFLDKSTDIYGCEFVMSETRENYQLRRKGYYTIKFN